METEKELDLKHLVQITAGMLAAETKRAPNPDSKEAGAALSERVAQSAEMILNDLKRHAEAMVVQREADHLDSQVEKDKA